MKIAARSIQAIGLDNSKQYTSATFNRFCKESRIHHKLIVPYTPQLEVAIGRAGPG